MMKRLQLIACTVLFTGIPARAGTVTFDPAVRIVDPAIDPTTTFDMSVSSANQIALIGSVQVLIGSDDLLLVDWYDRSCDCFDCCPPWGSPTPEVYPSEVLAESFYLTPPSLPVWLGRLTIDVGDLAPGTYQVLVDGHRDGGVSSVVSPSLVPELLFGSAKVEVIPEPATLALLAVGAVFALLRPWRPRPARTGSQRLS